MNKFHLYGIGNALVDTEIEVTDEFLASANVDKGVMTLVDEARQHELLDALANHAEPHKKTSGGSAANTIIAAQYFGARTFYTCRVADDDMGRFYVNDLKAAGVACNFDGEIPYQGITGKCLVMITPDAERTMNTFLGISEQITREDLDEAAIAQSDYAYLEGYLVTSETGRDAAIALRQKARSHGNRVALTFSDPFIVEHCKDGLLEMIGDGVDILFCNEAEALAFTGKENLSDALAEIRTFAQQAAITRGGDGAWIFDGQTTLEIPATPVKAIDTNGAGDMFAGAFLYGISQGYSHQQAGQLACRAAAELVTHFGARLPADVHQQIKSEIL